MKTLTIKDNICMIAIYSTKVSNETSPERMVNIKKEVCRDLHLNPNNFHVEIS